MAVKKTSKKPVELLDTRASIAIISTVKLETITLKNLEWLCKLRIGSLLPKSYYLYKILMSLNEQPYLDRIEELEMQLRGTLFEEDKESKRQLEKNVNIVKKDLEERRAQCEPMQFNANVEKIEYSNGGTTITCRVPDDIIESFNRQKTRFNYYQISLEPRYEHGATSL